MIAYILLFLSVFIGYTIAFYINTAKSNKWLALITAFSGSFLLSITVFELFPEIYFNSSNKYIGLFVMLGVLLQILLEFFSKGAEHGHVHKQLSSNTFPFVLFISLAIHAFIEGFPIHNDNHMLEAVIIHKIPIAIILSIFFLKSNFSPKITLLFLFLFATMTPLGNWASKNIPELIYHKKEITAVAIGIILHVSTIILFESSKNHTFNLAKVLSILIGVILAFLI